MKTLTDEEIEKAADSPKINPIQGSGYRVSREERDRFMIGAKFARDFYEKDREADRQEIERLKERINFLHECLNSNRS